MRKTALVVAVVMVLGVVAGIAAAQTDGDDTLYACAHKTNGKLRMVDGPEDCKKTENAVWWNQTGPVGPAGPTGPIGPEGPPGSSGLGEQMCTEAGSSVVGFDADGTIICHVGGVTTTTTTTIPEPTYDLAGVWNVSYAASDLCGFEFNEVTTLGVSHDLGTGQFWVTWTDSQGSPWEATGFSTGPAPIDVVIDDVIGGVPGTVVGASGRLQVWENPPDPDMLDLRLDLFVYCEVEPGLFDLFDFYAEFDANR